MSFHQINLINFLFFSLISSIISLNLFSGRTSNKECCIPPNVNVNSQKANAGKDLLERLIIPTETQEEITPEEICDFVHFLFQQASMNNKPVPFTEGDFSSNSFSIE